jgi:uncharacterized membrane protein
MTRTIKVHRLAEDASEKREVSVEEAEKILQEAYARGNIVVNKQIGEVIDEITPDVEEIILVQVVAGG